jgi:hypothetical protein
MTDYRGSQAWRKELTELLRKSGTPPSAVIIRGKGRGLTDEQIAERWRELGGRHGRGRHGECSVKNVVMRWWAIDQTLTGYVPPPRYPRQALDIARTLVMALHSPDASPRFLRAGEAYYRQLYRVNPKKIPADWRDWNPLARAR